MKANVTTEHQARCLGILTRASQAMTAIDIAVMLQLAGNRETQRRKVRAIVKRLRDNCGAKIVATLCGGYGLTEDEAIWREYLGGRKIDAKRILGAAHKKTRQINCTGQQMLFGAVAYQ